MEDVRSTASAGKKTCPGRHSRDGTQVFIAPHLSTQIGAPHHSHATQRPCHPLRLSLPACWSWGQGSHRRQRLHKRVKRGYMAVVPILPDLTFPGDPNPMQHWVWAGCQQAELPTQPSGNQFFTWERSGTGFLLSLGPADDGRPKGLFCQSIRQKQAQGSSES